MKVDVVIPSIGEPSLFPCLKSVRQNINVNSIILIVPSYFKRQADLIADKVITLEEKNIGLARHKGLEAVETDYYASIDSDVLVNRKWFEWCIKTIVISDVGACQGYARSIAKNFSSIQDESLKKSGGKDLTCLGNTMLKTEVVKKVGMPKKRFGEDFELRSRIEKAGFKWVSNIAIICEHLRTDMDILKHTIRWEKSRGTLYLNDPLKNLAYHLSLGFLDYPTSQNMFQIWFNICKIYGSLRGYRNVAFTCY